MEKIRLNKFLADSGVVSRRKADELISEGLITVNGKKVYELGVKIDPEYDQVKYQGKLVKPEDQKVYYAFYKPKNVVTTTADPQGRFTVLDYFKKSKYRLFPVGRLDWDTEGLLFITNDGEFANRVSNPKSNILKTYHAKLSGVPGSNQLEKLKTGVSIEGGGRVRAERVEILPGKSDQKGWVAITITEGKNRQIRKMFTKIGFDVLKLKRVSIGSYKVGNMKAGDIIEMSLADIQRVFHVKPEKTEYIKKKNQKVSIKRIMNNASQK